MKLKTYDINLTRHIQYNDTLQLHHNFCLLVDNDCSSNVPPLICDAAKGYCYNNTGVPECRCNDGYLLNNTDFSCTGMYRRKQYHCEMTCKNS